MTRKNILQAITLANKTAASSYIVTDAYMQLLKLSRKLSKLDCDNCNGDINEGEYEIKVNEIYKQIENTTLTLHLFYYHQSDPRGASLYVDSKFIPDDAYTNALAIY